MADLADEGYLSQPHTSAGRLPTEKAFRYYVQSLVAGRMPAAAAQRVRAELSESETMEDRVERSCHILTELSDICTSVGILERGSLVVAGSDWAVVPDPDPWLAIETSVTRKAPGGGGAAFGPGEAITVRQAVAMFTINAARQMGLDKRLGSIEVGKQADLVVIDHDPFGVPVTEIHAIKVQQTYIAGRKVFEREH